MGALGSGGGSKDEHVKVEEEPPEGVVSMESAYVVVIAWMVWSCRQRKLEQLRCLRWWRHVNQKSGG
jgi:hypothetical protein